MRPLLLLYLKYSSPLLLLHMRLDKKVFIVKTPKKEQKVAVSHHNTNKLQKKKCRQPYHHIEKSLQSERSGLI